MARKPHFLISSAPRMIIGLLIPGEIMLEECFRYNQRLTTRIFFSKNLPGISQPQPPKPSLQWHWESRQAPFWHSIPFSVWQSSEKSKNKKLIIGIGKINHDRSVEDNFSYNSVKA